MRNSHSPTKVIGSPSVRVKHQGCLPVAVSVEGFGPLFMRLLLRRHQPGVVVKRLELAAEMMRTDAGFHADQARRHLKFRRRLHRQVGWFLTVQDAIDIARGAAQNAQEARAI